MNKKLTNDYKMNSFVYLCRFFMYMLYNTIIKPFLEEVSANPDKTAAKIDGKVITNSQFTQLVAPIMNEMDAMSVDRICILTENELSVYAALMAGIFNNVTVIPVSRQLDADSVENILLKLNIKETLTASRMHYYFRMTFNDALCRIDNGLHNIEDDNPLCIIPSVDKNSQLLFKNVFAKDFRNMKRFSYIAFFNKIISKDTGLCFTF